MRGWAGGGRGPRTDVHHSRPGRRCTRAAPPGQPLVLTPQPPCPLTHPRPSLAAAALSPQTWPLPPRASAASAAWRRPHAARQSWPCHTCGARGGLGWVGGVDGGVVRCSWPPQHASPLALSPVPGRCTGRPPRPAGARHARLCCPPWNHGLTRPCPPPPPPRLAPSPDHPRHCQQHAAELLGGDGVTQEGPAPQQHQDGLAVAQHLRGMRERVGGCEELDWCGGWGWRGVVRGVGVRN